MSRPPIILSRAGFLAAAADTPFETVGGDPTVFRKELIYPGSFTKRNKDGTVEFELMVDDLAMDHWEQQFQDMQKAGVEVPIAKGHTTDPELRRGTVDNIKKEFNPSRGANSLFMYGHFRDPAAAQMAKTTQVSLYSEPKFFDGKDNEYTYPITHVALTDRPLIPGLSRWQTIAASLPGAFVCEDSMPTVAAAQADVTYTFGDEGTARVFFAKMPGSSRNGKSVTVNVKDIPSLNAARALATKLGGASESHGSVRASNDQQDPNMTPIQSLAQMMGVDYPPGATDEDICNLIMTAWTAEETAEPPDAVDLPVADPSMVPAASAAAEPPVPEAPMAPVAPPAPEEPKKPPMVPASLAASFDAMVGEAISARNSRLESLVMMKKITPAERDDMKKTYCSKQRVAFALSHATFGDGFNDLALSLEKREERFPTGERTSAQHNADDEKSPLVADAVRRAEKAKGN